LSFPTDLDRTSAAEIHALRITAAQITMVNIILPLNERMKGARFCKGSFPDKPETMGFLIRLVVIHAEHFFALYTYHRFACAGLQIVLKNPDG
jgi:hypothetical protein